MITSIIIVALISGIVASILTWTIIDGKVCHWYESAVNEADDAYMQVSILNSRLKNLAEEHERLKQYVYTYVSYLPNRVTPKEEKKEEKENESRTD